jgi:hypothetical protein
MKAIKRIKDPPGIHLCSFKGGIVKRLETMGYPYWTMRTH